MLLQSDRMPLGVVDATGFAPDCASCQSLDGCAISTQTVPASAIYAAAHAAAAAADAAFVTASAALTGAGTNADSECLGHVVPGALLGL